MLSESFKCNVNLLNIQHCRVQMLKNVGKKKAFKTNSKTIFSTNLGNFCERPYSFCLQLVFACIIPLLESPAFNCCMQNDVTTLLFCPSCHCKKSASILLAILQVLRFVLNSEFNFFSGFFDRREFIVSQHPLENTMASFWRMVWEQEVSLVVVLSSFDSQV